MTEREKLEQGWRNLPCTRTILNISLVLCSGQSFRWKEKDGCWTGVHKRKVWKLKQDDQNIWYKVLSNTEVESDDSGDTQKVYLKRKRGRKPSSSNGMKVPKLGRGVDLNNNHLHQHEMSDEEILSEYFQLSVDLDGLCNGWAKMDSNFATIWKIFPGVRMLRQDPVENLFSFICSSNNNITRISSMVEKMCFAFGDKLPCNMNTNEEYFAFPDVRELAQPKTEEVLRKLGFGYRAKYIHQSAVQIEKNGGDAWLNHLRSLPYKEALAELIKLPGIGAKVADCICMMSLDKSQAIPVDTHVWQIATRDYTISEVKNTKTLTSNTYKAIGDFFRNLWGSHAAWAMNFLFVADLKHFQYLKQEKDRKLDFRCNSTVCNSEA